MSTLALPVSDTEPFTIHREIDTRNAYELTRAIGNAWLHVFEGHHDAAILLAPQRLVEMRADLATMLIRLGHGVPQLGAGTVRSPVGIAIVEHIRQAFLALVELDKSDPAEVDAIAALIVGHVRSWRPFALQEVVGG